MENERNNLPFLERFMLPPDDYELFKFGGSSLKDEERGIKTMLKYFSSYFTEEQLKENMARHNLQTMFGIVKKYFAKEYGYTGAGIELSNIYQNTINSYIYNDKVNPALYILMNCLNQQLWDSCWQCLNGLRILRIWRHMENALSMYCS